MSNHNAGSATGIDLAPCPFCGSAAHVETEFRHNRVIECGSCGANIGAVDLARGIAMWNARATPQHPDPAIATLRKYWVDGNWNEASTESGHSEISDALTAVIWGGHDRDAATPQHSVTEQDERTAFEVAMMAKGLSTARAADEYGGRYRFVEQEWIGWQAARAQPLASTAATQPEQASEWEDCNHCNGTRLRDGEECQPCGGTGRQLIYGLSTDAGEQASYFAVRFIEQRAQKYLQENASSDPDIGAVIFNYGEAGQDYYNTLVELADDLRAALAIPASTAPKESK